MATTVEHPGLFVTSIAHEAPEAAFASTALRKGAQLLKYCRRGRPHACHVQLSADESEIQWVSGAGKPRAVRLAAVKDVLAGQTTAVFRRLPGLHDARLSFSVVFTEKDAERSLDLVCKDEEQRRLWFTGLQCAIAKLNSLPSGAAGGAQAQAAVRAAVAAQRWKSGASVKPSTPRQVQPLGGWQASARVSGAVGLPPPPPPLPGEVFIWGHHAGMPSDTKAGGGKRPQFDAVSRSHAERAALLPSALPRADGLDVTAVSLGTLHGALLSRAGQVFTWGRADHGRLGHGSQHHTAVPTRVDALSGTRVVQVTCGDAQTAAVTEDGQLFVWGETSVFGVLGHSATRTQWVPRAVQLPGVVVQQVALGPWHGALIATDGALYTWGEGTFGALGHGDCKDQLLPRRVAALAGFTATQVACGAWHTAALARSAQPSDGGAQLARLFTWGDGDKGQLGNSRKGIASAPACVEGELAGLSIKQVACGAFHTVALTTVGGVYAAGKDCSGPTKPAFRAVQGALAGLRADEIACGDAHTAVVASQRRRLYTWGAGAGGRLGHGDLSNCDMPKLVERLRDRDLLQVVCGPQCTAVVCACPQLSLEQKAALARSSDGAGRGDRNRSSAKAAPPVERSPATAQAAATNAAALPTRGSLLARTALVSAAPAAGAVAAEWRARALEADVRDLRLSLRNATAEIESLKAQLEASHSHAAQLARRLEAGASADAIAEPADDGVVMPASATLPISSALAAQLGGGDTVQAGAAAQPLSSADFVQEVEPGVYVTVSAGRVLRRVRFDRRAFTDEQAQDWWEHNRAAIMSRLGLVLPSARPRRTQE